MSKGELPRDRCDCAHVRRHVLADPPVATCRSARQTTILVGQRDRQAVDLRLADQRRPILRSQQLLQAGAPGEDLLERGDLVEAHHGRAVGDSREQRRGRYPDGLRRRVRFDQLGMLLLERQQLVLQSVVFGVSDVRSILEVILRVVALDERAQLVDSGQDSGGRVVGLGAHAKDGRARL